MKKFSLPLFFVVVLLLSSHAHAVYVDNGDGTVTDTVTRLRWQQADNGVQCTWEDALDYCETRTPIDGHEWRLPNIRELNSLVDLSHYDPTIDPAFECRSSSYWSGSTNVCYPDIAWIVVFQSGYVSRMDKNTTSCYVRCVCSGPSGPFDSSISLASGWNLVSLSLSPTDPAIEEVLTPIAGSYSGVWSYQNGQWLVYDPLDPTSATLKTMETGYSYWIRMIKADTLPISGMVLSQSVNLKKGWNLVGYNDSEPLPTATALASINGQLELVWSYQKGAWLMYDPKNTMFSDLDVLTPDCGYWIKVKDDCIWTLP